MSVSRTRSYNNQAVQVLNKVLYDIDGNPIGLYEDPANKSSCNFGTIRDPRRGGCYSFSGIGEYISTTSITRNSSLEISYSFWVNMSRLTYSNRCISMGEASAIGWQASSQNLYFAFGNSIGDRIRISAGSSITFNTWHHLVVTKSVGKTASTIKIYLNGVLQTNTVDENTLTSDNVSIFQSIGYNGNVESTNQAPPIGKITNLQIFSRQLSKPEIDKLYNKNFLRSDILHYKCDENYGSVCYDSSGNGYHGTIFNTITVTPEVNSASVHGYQDLYSFHNEVGYNKTSTTYIPRNENVIIPPFKDVLGSDLQYIGKVPSKVLFFESNCFQGNYNGVIQSPIVFKKDYIAISFGFVPYNCYKSTSEYLFCIRDRGNANNAYSISIDDNGIFTISSRITDTFYSIGNVNYGVYNTCEVRIYNGYYKCTLNGSVFTGSFSTGTWSGLSNFIIGDAFTTAYGLYGYNGESKIFNLKLSELDSLGNTVSLMGYWPLCEEIVTTSNHIYYDCSGNGYHCTLLNATLGNGGKQDFFHYLQHGVGGNTYSSISTLAFDQWTKTSTVTLNSTTAPDNTTTACKLTELTSAGKQGISRVPDATYVDYFTMEVCVKNAGSNYLKFGVGGYSCDVGCVVDLTTGTFGTLFQSGGQILSNTITTLVDGWYKVKLKIKNNSLSNPTPQNIYIQCARLDTTNTPFNNTYTGDGSSGIYIWGFKFDNTVDEYKLPTLINNHNLDVLGNAVINAQDGYSYLPSGCFIRQYQQPSLIQADNTSKMWFDNNNTPIDVDYLTLRLIDPISERIFVDNHSNSSIGQIVTHNVLSTKQKALERKTRNVTDVVISTTESFSMDISITDYTYILSNYAGYTMNGIIDWGDGNTQTVNTSAAASYTHTYTTNGVKTIQFTGTMEYCCPYYGSNATNAAKVIRINKWGSLKARYINFNNCTNLVTIPNTPITCINSASLTSLDSLFQNCSKLQCDIPENLLLYAPKVTSANRIFQNCSKLTGSIPSNLFRYCVSLQNIQYGFSGCSSISGMIPEDLFKYNLALVNITDFFVNCVKLYGVIPENLLRYNTQLTTITNLFSGCSGLSGTVPETLLSACTKLTTILQLFANCTGLTGIIPTNFFKYNTLLTNASYVFTGCSNLTGSIPATLLSTCINLVTIAGIFQNCAKLTGSIPATLLSSNVNLTDAVSIFYGCRGLTGSIPTDLLRYNTKITSIASLFYNCTGLTGSIPATLFSSCPSITIASSVFYNCKGLTGSIDSELFRYNVAITTFASTFIYCSGLTGSIPATLFSSCPNVTSFVQTFYYCSGLTGSIPATLFSSCPNVTSFSSTFQNCLGLTGVIDSELFRYNTLVTTFANTFLDCQNMTGSIPATLFSSCTKVLSFAGTFQRCSKLTGSIDSELFRYNVLATSFGLTFYGCSGLTGTIPSTLFSSCPNVTVFTQVFYGCTGLTGSISVDLFKFNTLITSVRQAFYNCLNLTGSLPVGIFDTNTLLTDVGGVFQACSKLTGTITTDIFKNNTAITIMDYVYSGCSSLTGSISADIFSLWPNLTTVAYFFSGCSGLTGTIPLTLLTLNTKLTSVAYLFNGCTGIVDTLPVGLFDTNTLLTDASGVFYGCTGLTGSLTANLFKNCPSITSLIYTYRGCKNLTGSIPVDLLTIHTNLLYISGLFYGCTGLTGTIPEDLFRYNTKLIRLCESVLYTANNYNGEGVFTGCTGLTGSIPTNLLRYNPDITDISALFYNCTGLTGTIPTDFLRYNTKLLKASYLFAGTKLTDIPATTFRYNTLLTTLIATFYNMSNITAIPVDLLRYNTQLVTVASLFQSCITLVTIPTDTFRYNTLITTFASIFNGCVVLLSIPDNIFRYNTQVTTFNDAFNGCVLLNYIPTDIFRYNTLVTSFSQTFYNCYKLVNLPSDIFYYNSAVTTYYQTFQNCRNMILPTRMFNTANISKVTTFVRMMAVSAAGYSHTGTMQDIWNYASSTATTTDAFNYDTAISNYASMPAAWT